MEGLLGLRLPQLTRTVLIRGSALIPAIAVAAAFGSAGMSKLLALSRLILGIVLPFAVMPLLWFTTRRIYLGDDVLSPLTSTLPWITAAFVVAINAWVIAKFFFEKFEFIPPHSPGAILCP